MKSIHKLTDHDLDMFEWARNTYYLKDQKISITTVYYRMIGEKYVSLDENGHPVLLPEEERPTISQFKRYIAEKKEEELSLELSARSKGTEFDLEDSEKLYHLDYGGIGPGFCFLADSTKMDWDLVSVFDRSRNIGRPTLTVLIDLFCRLLFCFISLGEESFDSYRYALHFAFSPKKEYYSFWECERFADAFPEPALPFMIVSDNSSMKTHQSDQICSNLGIHLETTRPYTPYEKGIVEAAINSVTDALTVKILDKIQKDEGVHGAAKYEEKAFLTFPEMWKLVCMVNKQYNLEHFADIPIAPDLAISKPIQTPLNLWNWGITHRSGCLRSPDPAQINVLLLPHKSGVVTPNGVSFNDHYYHHQYAIDHDWYVEANQKSTHGKKQKEKRHPEFFYDEWMEKIYYLAPADSKHELPFIIPFSMITDEKYTFTQITRSEEQIIKSRLKTEASKIQSMRLKEQAENILEAKQITDQAHQLTKEAMKETGKLDTENKKKNSRPDRAFEKSKLNKLLYDAWKEGDS